jgi:hypothetical protein
VGVSVIGKSIRWMLVPVAAAAVVVFCVVAARAAISLVDQRCPAGSMVGGACVEPWHTTAVEAAIYTGLVVAVLALVILPAMLAPQYKRAVAVVLFVAAVSVTAAAWIMTTWAEMMMLVAVTVLTGGIALGWVWSRVWSRGPSNERS